MPEIKALYAYTQERMNCAQSVLRAYQESHGLSDEKIQEARAHGGGRADGGLCGALYAALQLAKSEEVRAELRRQFRETAGAETCREIKNGSGYPCKDCVGLAARLLNELQP